ncbi:basic helix-loop-helix (bHLH) DNA-binding superfamily protein [Euphorbia peplus]|nr:basic helix-loop-helix (bHLH) DNA-binding superfamily protein [Euphorbia peplus]
MEFLSSSIDELCITEEEEEESRDDFKSKNLEAERRRRKKLSDYLLTLRSLVPIITKMTKEATIQDAITYIETLKNDVYLLTQELLQIDASESFSVAMEEAVMTGSADGRVDGAEEDIKPCLITEDIVEVSKVTEKKMWIKITIYKKPGRFSKLMEAMFHLGFELTETTATTCKGLMLVTSFVQSTYEKFTVEETKEHLLQIVRSI